MRSRPTVPAPALRGGARALRDAAVAADGFICASLTWLLLLALELNAGRPEPAQLGARALYLVTLACRYSLLYGAALLLVHALRRLLLRVAGQRADRWLSALLALAIAIPAYQQAELLTSGGLLLESTVALPVRAGILVVLVSANLMLWHVHLLLCRPRGYQPWAKPGRRARRLWRVPRVLRSACWLLPGGFLLGLFATRVSQGLRAYVFLSQFLLPSAWLFATSLGFGLLLRLRRRAALRALGAIALAAGLSAAAYDERDVRRARPQFERRGGLVALTDLGVSFERGAPYANLDIERPERFSCPPQEDPRAPAPLPTPEPKRRNVILISIDTLRKDALEMEQDGRPVAPALRALAARSVSFERAITTYPATLFALSSALTGQSPSEVLFAPEPPPNLFTQTKPYLREQLIALPSTSWFRRSPVPELMTQRALPTYWPDAERSTSWLIARLRAARAARLRTFAWIHYFEPHGARTTGRGSAAIQSAHDSYAELVRRVDVQIGRLTEELDKLGYLEDSLLIVFSDHGEALGELDYFGHHVYLNQFATDVPLLVYAPGQPARRSERLVLLSDIAPTVLDWVGVKSAPGDARSLFEELEATERYGMSEAFPIRGRALYDLARLPIRDAANLAQRMQIIRTAAIDYQPKVALVSARYRLIVNRVSGAEEFYDRVRDPTEEKDLSQDGLSALQDMREALRGRLERLSQRIYCRVAKNP